MNIEVTLSFDNKLAQWKARCHIPENVVMNAEEHPGIMESIGGSLDHVMLLTKDFFADKKTRDGERVDVLFKFGDKDNVAKIQIVSEKNEKVEANANTCKGQGEDNAKEVIQEAEKRSLQQAESITESLCGILPMTDPEPKEKSHDMLLNDTKSFICSVDDTCTCPECGTMLTMYNVIAKPAYEKFSNGNLFYIKLIAYCPLCGRELQRDDIDNFNNRSKRFWIPTKRKDNSFTV